MALLCLVKGKFYKVSPFQGYGIWIFFAGEIEALLQICEIDPFTLTFCTLLQKFDIDDFTEK